MRSFSHTGPLHTCCAGSISDVHLQKCLGLTVKYVVMLTVRESNDEKFMTSLTYCSLNSE
jgi:hypothetical protein